MHIRKKRPWEIPEREAVPEEVFLNRRQAIKKLGSWSVGAGALAIGADPLFGLLSSPRVFGLFEDAKPIIKIPETPTSHLYPAIRNERFVLGDRVLTDEELAAKYNNFYEFSANKDVYKHVGDMEPRPWQIEVTGLVEKPRTFDIDSLVKEMALEERLYRFRCVEAWAMAVPWTGFPMRDFVKKMRPLSSAKFIRMETFYKKSWSPGQRYRFWLPWPYQEGLTMAEATNELAFLATGIYGHELPNQHGAPIRLVVPWKYGFKNIKSIVRIDFTAEAPQTFWNTLVPNEYDFQANVDPRKPHPRWSQATERLLGVDKRVETRLYNGYEEFVAGLYA